MKIIHILLITTILFSCSNETKNIDSLIQRGEFSEAINLIELKLKSKRQISTNESDILQGKLYEMLAVKREYTLSYPSNFLKIAKCDINFF